MPINFPSSPANNQTYSYGNQTWYWNNAYSSWIVSTYNGRFTSQQFTGNGSTTTFTFSGGYVPDELDVYLNGVLLRRNVDVITTNGSTFTISPAPANGALIDAKGLSAYSSTGVTTTVSQQFTANGTANSFTVTGGYTPNQILVFLNGVKQMPANDVIITSGNTVNFVVTPANNYIIDVYGYQAAITSTSNTLTVIGAVTANTLTLNSAFIENDPTISTNYTISTGKNAMSAGPITVANGVTVTVPTGSTWTIV